jgi:hypothetical protein
MKTHPYVRAYMAGITIPTMVLVAVAVGFTLARHVYDVPIPIERAIVFPMAGIPNLWGLWNMLYLAVGGERRWPIGVHGAVLPLLIVPIGLALAQLLAIDAYTPQIAALFVPIGIAIYYLAWKYFVGFFNAMLGIG